MRRALYVLGMLGWAALALWFVWRYWNQIRRQDDAPPALCARPSWAGHDPRYTAA